METLAIIIICAGIYGVKKLFGGPCLLPKGSNPDTELIIANSG